MCRLLISFENERRELKPVREVWDLVREKAQESEQIFVPPKSGGKSGILLDFWFCSLSFATNPDRISFNLIGG